MHKRLLGGSVAAAVVAGLMLATAAPAANAATPTEVHQGDFIPDLSDTRSAGHYAFTADGLHVWTDDATGQAKVAEYFAADLALSDVVGATPPAWTGTATPPGSQIVFDADGILGNGIGDFNILVGEAVYQTNDPAGDWWLSTGSSAMAKAASPRPPGGSGTDWHGPLGEWSANLPNAKVYALGFSLGSGVKGDGVLSSLSFGSAEYTFAGLGMCDVDVDHGTSTFTLLADCTTDNSVYVDSGWTVDGDGHKLTATETPVTSFRGAVLQNDGTSMRIRDLTVTTSGWDKPTANSGGNLAGIRFKDAAGSVDNVTISGISHGNGVQEGNALDIDNFGGSTQRAVTVSGVTVTKYQKTGIRANGNVKLTLTNSTVTAAGTPDSGSPIGDKTAANSVQVSRGATGTISGNAITGNDWDGLSNDDATAVLLFNSGAVTVQQNVITGAGTDIGVGAFGATGAVKIRCNVVSRTADPDAVEKSDTGIFGDGNASASVVDNTITGFGTATDGVTNVVNQGVCLPATPAVSTSGVTPTSANVSWSSTALPYAPVTGWELVGPKGIVTLPSGTTTYALTGLQAGVAYNVSVRAINVSGTGAAGSANFTTPVATSSSTLTVSPSKVVYKSSTTASGVLKLNGAGAAGQTVTLWRFAAGAWAKVGTATTAANGSWSLSFKPVVSGNLQATATGFPTATSKVTVALKVKATAKPHAVKVKVSPKVPGGEVVLQKKKNGAWKKVASTTLSAKSKAKFTNVAKGKYRVIAKKVTGFAKGTSPTVKVKR